MRKPTLGLCFSALFLTANAHAVKLNIDTDYRLRGLAYSNLDYDSATSDSQSFYTQRLRLAFGAKELPKNVEVGLKLQALDMAGRSTVLFPFDGTAGRYPNTAFTPWLENAYVKVNNFLDWPLTLTVGRQPLELGTGLLVSDNDLGFTALRLESDLPWDIGFDLFTAKPQEGQAGEHDADLHGISLSKLWRGQWELLYLIERNRTGTAFSGTTTNLIDKRYYDLRYDLEKENCFADAELVMGKGDIHRTDGTSAKAESMAYLLQAGASTEAKKLGKTELTFIYGMGSGDDPASTDKDEGFFPRFGRRFDGLERDGYGEFFGATLYDALPSTTTVNGLAPGVSGIGVIGFGATVSPFHRFTFGMGYYVFKAQESTTKKDLGSEMDLRASFRHSENLSFRLTYGMFSPGEASLAANHTQATRLMFETQAKF